jgi:acyl carrier protein
MDRTEVFALVRAALAEALELPEEEISEESHFEDDLEADSLDLVELLLEMEQRFGFKVSDDEAADIETVGAAVDLILRKAAA